MQLLFWRRMSRHIKHGPTNLLFPEPLAVSERTERNTASGEEKFFFLHHWQNLFSLEAREPNFCLKIKEKKISPTKIHFV